MSSQRLPYILSRLPPPDPHPAVSKARHDVLALIANYHQTHKFSVSFQRLPYTILCLPLPNPQCVLIGSETLCSQSLLVGTELTPAMCSRNLRRTHFPVSLFQICNKQSPDPSTMWSPSLLIATELTTSLCVRHGYPTNFPVSIIQILNVLSLDQKQ